MMKEEALKLADELDALHQYVPSEAPAMIRRLVEELDRPLSDDAIDKVIHELRQRTFDHNRWVDIFAVAVETIIAQREELDKQTKPLNHEEIYDLWCDADNTEWLPEMRMKDGSINYVLTTFVKLLEERHGIK